MVEIEVTVGKNETVDKALKRLKKILDREGLMKQVKMTRFFEKPSEKRRRREARARAKARALAACSK